MRFHTVAPGESPASIAARYAGCPKCSRDLIAANPAKPSVVYPNGYRTFATLAAGERLALPDKWFDGTLDRLPKSYFAGLPSADGRARYGLGDVLSDNGITPQAAGSYALDASGLGQQLPPSVTSTLQPYAAGIQNFSGMTEQQQTVFAEQVTASIAAAIPGAGPVLSGLLEYAFQAVGLAQSGPGCCGSTPDLTQPLGSCGANEFSWTQNFGSYPPPTPGTFEAFFEQIALADLQLVATCWTKNAQGQAVSAAWSPSVTMARLPALLLAAVAAWNKTHGAAGTPATQQVLGLPLPIVVPNSGGTRTIAAKVNTASGAFPCGVPSAWDPISVALEGVADAANAAAAKAAGAPAGCFTGAGSLPVGALLHFTVNNGPASATTTAVSSPSSSSSTSSAPAVIAGTAAAGAAGLALYAFATKQTLSAAAKGLWKHATGRSR